MSQKLPVDGFEWKKDMSKFNEKFMKNYDENSDVKYPKRLHNLHNDLPFLPEEMEIKKCNKLVCNLYDKNHYVAHKRTLKPALNHRLIFKKVR